MTRVTKIFLIRMHHKDGNNAGTPHLTGTEFLFIDEKVIGKIKKDATQKAKLPSFFKRPVLVRTELICPDTCRK